MLSVVFSVFITAYIVIVDDGFRNRLIFLIFKHELLGILQKNVYVIFVEN